MTGFWFSLGLCVVLLIPEPATFALLVLAAAGLAVCTLRAASSRVEEYAKAALRGTRRAVPSTPAE